MKPKNMCSLCGEDFDALSGFDAHRVGTHEYTYSEGVQMDPMREDGRRCLSANEMTSLGFYLDDAGRWRVAANVRNLARAEL